MRKLTYLCIISHHLTDGVGQPETENNPCNHDDTKFNQHKSIVILIESNNNGKKVQKNKTHFQLSAHKLSPVMVNEEQNKDICC
jgi:hypothetical protein